MIMYVFSSNRRFFNMGKKVTKVFYISLLIALLFIVWGIVPSSILPTWNLNNITTNIQGFIVDKFDWFYITFSNFIPDLCYFLSCLEIWEYQIRKRSRQTRIQLFNLVRNVIQCRNGNWACILGSCGTYLAFQHASLCNRE